VELRARSAFSFLEGASAPEDLVDCAAALGYDAIALGDRDGLYGAPRFYQAATRSGIKAIVGAEVTLEEGFDEEEARLPLGQLCTKEFIRIASRRSFDTARGARRLRMTDCACK